MFFAYSFFCEYLEVDLLVLSEFGNKDVIVYKFDIYFLGGLVALGNPLQLIRIDFVRNILYHCNFRGIPRGLDLRVTSLWLSSIIFSSCI